MMDDDIIEILRPNQQNLASPTYPAPHVLVLPANANDIRWQAWEKYLKQITPQAGLQ